MRLLLLLIFAFGSFAFQNPWKEFTDYDGRFRLLVPYAMTKKDIPFETAIGTLTYHTYYYQPDEKDPDNILYMLSYCDYPEGGMHSDSLDLLSDFFEATVETAVESVQGELLYKDDLIFEGYPGKLWRVVYQDGEASIKTKAVLVNNRFYMIQAVGLREKGLNPLVDKYLDSFRIVEEETNEEK